MHALLTLARNERTRECLLLLEAILETPGLLPRLSEVLRPKLEPKTQQDGARKSKTRQPKTPQAETRQVSARKPGVRKQGAQK